MSSVKPLLLQLLADPRVAELQALDRQFNPFRVLGVERYEIRHVNVLAWLLTPDGNHGLGDGFLRLFLNEVCRQGGDVLSRIAASGMSGVHVRREVTTKELSHLVEAEIDAAIEGQSLLAPTEPVKGGALDLVVRGPDWIVAVEVKLHASEGDGQLVKYRKALQAGQSRQAVELAFLTKDEDSGEPNDPAWRHVHWYETVISPLRRLLSRETPLPAQQYGFLQSYLQTLESQLSVRDSARELLVQELVQDHATLFERLRETSAATMGLTQEEKDMLQENSAMVAALAPAHTPLNKLRAEQLREAYGESFTIVNKNDSTNIKAIYTAWKYVPWMWDSADPKLPALVCEFKNLPKSDVVWLKILINDLVPPTGVSSPNLKYRRHLLYLVQKNPTYSKIFNEAFHNGQPKQEDPKYFTIYRSPRRPATDAVDMINNAMSAICKLTELVQQTTLEIDREAPR